MRLCFCWEVNLTRQTCHFAYYLHVDEIDWWHPSVSSENCFDRVLTYFFSIRLSDFCFCFHVYNVCPSLSLSRFDIYQIFIGHWPGVHNGHAVMWLFWHLNNQISFKVCIIIDWYIVKSILFRWRLTRRIFIKKMTELFFLCYFSLGAWNVELKASISQFYYYFFVFDICYFPYKYLM